jgi:hypothetical protein
MARFVLRGSILKNFLGSIPRNLAGSILTNPSGSIIKNLTGSSLKKILIVATCGLAFACVQTSALAQHAGGHVGGGGHPSGGGRMSAPASAPISRPRGFVGPRGVGPHAAGPRLAGMGPRGFGFRQRPINVFRRRQFFGAPFFRFGVGLGFNSLWWPTCGPSLGWGFDCYPTPFYGYGFGGYGFGGYGFGGYGFENYVTPQTYESSVYLYGGDERDLIWLYLKDGTVYGVTDYWLVNRQMHFSMVEDDPTKLAEHMIPYDELDVQKTIYVNTHRGFRIVFRDEPWQQYLKDHPDLTPPDVPPPQKN